MSTPTEHTTATGTAADADSRGGAAPGGDHFPFTAVVGADDMALALALAAVSPAVGGVLVRGEKGTAKSTMVRALTAVLPPVDVVPGCRFACDPAHPDPSCPDAARHRDGSRRVPARLVELPVGATEDRVVGSLHLDSLLASSEIAYEPGLLAAANRGVLYVDEVNLLPDHLVDTLLDAAAMGRARVEREGVSVSYAARFVLVGTMNPEEGDLRPQLLDRFGLAVDVAASREPALRSQVVRRRLAYEADPAGFAAGYADAERALAQRIAAAQDLLPDVVLGDEAVDAITGICAAFDVDGLRGDLVTARTAIAHAAWCGRTQVTDDDIRVAAHLALPHRRRRNPFDDATGPGDLDDILDDQLPQPPTDPQGPDDDPTDPTDPSDPDGGPGGGPGGGGDGSGGRDEAAGTDSDLPQPTPRDADAPADAPSVRGPGGTTGTAPGAPSRARLLAVAGSGQGVAGRRSTADTTTGRHVRAVAPSDPRGHGIAVTATVLTAAVRAAQADLDAAGGASGEGAGDLASGPALRLAASDLRRSIRRGKEGNLVVFAVDTSGSMGASKRVREVKTACVSLLLDAYQRRDKVAVVTFNGRRATTALAPTGSVELAERLLARVPTGGRTPLAEGLAQAYDVIRTHAVKDPHRRALLVVITDGRASAGGRDALTRAHATADALHAAGVHSVVVDAEEGKGFRLGLARDLAEHLGATYLSDLSQVHAGAGPRAAAPRGTTSAARTATSTATHPTRRSA